MFLNIYILSFLIISLQYTFGFKCYDSMTSYYKYDIHLCMSGVISCSTAAVRHNSYSEIMYLRMCGRFTELVPRAEQGRVEQQICLKMEKEMSSISHCSVEHCFNEGCNDRSNVEPKPMNYYKQNDYYKNCAGFISPYFSVVLIVFWVK